MSRSTLKPLSRKGFFPGPTFNFWECKDIEEKLHHREPQMCSISLEGRYAAFHHKERLRLMLNEYHIFLGGRLGILDLTDGDKITFKGFLGGDRFFLTALALPGKAPRFVTAEYVDGFSEFKDAQQIRFCTWEENQLAADNVSEVKPSSDIIIDGFDSYRKGNTNPWEFLVAFSDGRHLAMMTPHGGMCILDLQEGKQRKLANVFKPKEASDYRPLSPVAVLKSDCLAVYDKERGVCFFPTQTHSQGERFFSSVNQKSLYLPKDLGPVTKICAWPDGAHFAVTRSHPDCLSVYEFGMDGTIPSCVPRINHMFPDYIQLLGIASGQVLFKIPRNGRALIQSLSPKDTQVQDGIELLNVSGFINGIHQFYLMSFDSTYDYSLQGYSLALQLLKKNEHKKVEDMIGTHIDPSPLRRLVTGYLGMFSEDFSDSLKKETPMLRQLEQLISSYEKKSAPAEGKGDFKKPAVESKQSAIDVEALCIGLKALQSAVARISNQRYFDRMKEVFEKYPVLKLLLENKKFAVLIKDIRALDSHDPTPRP